MDPRQLTGDALRAWLMATGRITPNRHLGPTLDMPTLPIDGPYTPTKPVVQRSGYVC